MMNVCTVLLNQKHFHIASENVGKAHELQTEENSDGLWNSSTSSIWEMNDGQLATGRK